LSRKQETASVSPAVSAAVNVMEPLLAVESAAGVCVYVTDAVLAGTQSASARRTTPAV
jgi:hypothetical protein